MQTSFRMVSSLILVLGFAAGARELAAQCVNTYDRSSGTGDVIRLDGVLIGDSQLNAAASYWSACPTYGSGFASFTTADVSASVAVTVIYHGGHNQVCGQATHDSPSSIRIDLWDTGETTTGQTYRCNVTDTLAHELGHVLNLDNSTCQGYMMGPAPTSWQNGQLVAGTRSVSSDECSTANSGWSTTTDPDSGGGTGGGGGTPPCV